MNGICIDIYLHADMGYIGDMLMEYEWKHGGIMVGYYGEYSGDLNEYIIG